MTGKIAIIAACLVFGGLVAQRQPGWPGTYECDGTGERGPYRAKLDIDELTETYRLRWMMESGHLFTGVGLVIGVAANDLAVSYSDFTSTVGLAIYAKDGSGELQGRWTSIGADRVFTERCRRRGVRAARGSTGRERSWTTTH